MTGAPEEAVITYKRKGTSNQPVTLDADRNIVILCANQDRRSLEFTITMGEDSVVKEVSLADITFEEAPAAQE